jgi:mannose-1-phosphate guanylyltransferase / mannose-6-phosphate isomerase
MVLRFEVLVSPITPVILCGGAGNRLWPVSRESLAKQFAPLIGTKSTFQQALERVANGETFLRPIVITHADNRFIVAEQIRAVGMDAEIVLESDRRDSAPAVAVAAELIARQEVPTNVLILAADHLILDPEGFRATCHDAAPLASAGRIVTFGIRPTFAATNYGYIRPGARLGGSNAFAVEAFVEKPDAATAGQYVADGYLWNSGNFMFRPDVMLAEITRFEPAIAQATQAAVDNAERDLDFLRLCPAAFLSAPRKSIDYAVMERTTLAAVIPAEFQWSDVGSWDAVWRVHEHDDSGNAVVGSAELLDTHDCLVYSEPPLLTAVIGCQDLVIAATSDAILVVPREHADRVKSLVDRLKRSNHRAAIQHQRIFRPWGYFQRADAGERYQVKRILVKPGHTLSLQKHLHRSEHWVVVRGTAEATIDGEVHTLHENESIYVPIGNVHRLANPGKIPLELIEVQVGSYLGEDDIIRIEDVYRRE